jgi:hypothetical protein
VLADHAEEHQGGAGRQLQVFLGVEPQGLAGIAEIDLHGAPELPGDVVRFHGVLAAGAIHQADSATARPDLVIS